MTRQCNARHGENDTLKAQRVFTSIVNTAAPYMEIASSDHENCVAQGLLKTRQEGRRATLSFNPHQRTISMMVDFPVRDEITLPWAMILFRLQRQTATGTSSIIVDPESSIIRVRAQAPVPAQDVVRPVLIRAFRDTVRVLENNDFRSLAM